MKKPMPIVRVGMLRAEVRTRETGAAFLRQIRCARAKIIREANGRLYYSGHVAIRIPRLA